MLAGLSIWGITGLALFEVSYMLTKRNRNATLVLGTTLFLTLNYIAIATYLGKALLSVFNL